MFSASKLRPRRGLFNQTRADPVDPVEPTDPRGLRSRDSFAHTREVWRVKEYSALQASITIRAFRII